MGRKNLRPSREELKNTLYNYATLKEVAEHYKVTVGTIYLWIKYYKGLRR